MWEFSINLDNDNFGVCQFIFLNLKDEINRLGGLLIIDVCDDRNFITFAIPKSHIAYVKALIKQIIAEAVVEFYKLFFFTENISIPCTNLAPKIFLKALTVFDRFDDEKDIRKLVNIKGKEFNFQSFLSFALYSIKDKWQSIIDVVNENIPILDYTNSFIDLTKFLLQNINRKCGEVHIVKNQNNLLFCDKLLRPISFACIKLYDDNKLYNVICELISMAPCKIVWHISDEPDMYNLVQDIFQNS